MNRLALALLDGSGRTDDGVWADYRLASASGLTLSNTWMVFRAKWRMFWGDSGQRPIEQGRTVGCTLSNR